MSSPPSVNDLMEFLNETFGWKIPTLPLNGFMNVVKKLWQAAVSFIPDPKSPLPWEVRVIDYEIPLPGIHKELKNIKVLVRHSDESSPN